MEGRVSDRFRPPSDHDFGIVSFRLRPQGIKRDERKAAEPATARSLHRRAGYVEVDAFNDEPYAHHWFEKRLAAVCS
jgi:hypothetical protein